jgi:DNA-binding transcriptional LysR family regulator
MNKCSSLIDMGNILDIAPLRSLVAVADCGGFQRAADTLHLSQGAVSQHVRRLERALGRPLVERHGRGSRLTIDGEELLTRARRILASHDEALHHFGIAVNEMVVIGSTEHAAAQLLPALSEAVARTAPDHRFRFRIDRGARLRDGLSGKKIDLALLLGSIEGASAIPVGELDLQWYSSPTWSRPAGSVPVVAFDNPCVLRSRALETLTAHDIPAVVGAEATQLAGVQAAVGAGLGVALMATMGQTPEGLVRRDDLPTAAPVVLSVCARPGIDPAVPALVSDALRPLLSAAALA